MARAGFERERHAAEHAAAAHAKDDRIERLDILDDLQSERGVPLHQRQIVIGRDEGQAALGRELAAVRDAFLRRAVQDHLGAVLACCLRLCGAGRGRWPRNSSVTYMPASMRGRTAADIVLIPHRGTGKLGSA